MKKKGLTGIVLAILAICLLSVLASPVLAGSYITVTAPSNIDLGYMTAGEITTGFSATPGSVQTDATTWQVTAKDEKATNAGYMNTQADGGGTSLTAKFRIGKSASTYVDADVGFDYTQADGTSLPFYVSQVVAADAAPGSYQITITFTSSYQ